MAAVVTENWSDRTREKVSGVFKAGRGFMVTNATVNTEAAAIAAVVANDSTCGYNAGHPLSALMYCDGQKADPLGPRAWKVTISYSSNPAGRHMDGENPLSEPAAYSFAWSYQSEGCDRDRNGAPIVNAAGEPFADSIPTDVLNGWLYVEQNEPTYDATGAVSLSNTVNSTHVTFMGAWTLEPGQACCRKIEPMTQITTSSTYIRVRYSIELRGGFKKDSDGYWDAFKVRVLNAGRRGWVLNGSVPQMGPIVELVNGAIQPVNFDVRLDANGMPLDSHYKIGMNSAPGYGNPTNSTYTLASGVVIENMTTATFIKMFPQTIKLGSLSTLGL